MSRHNGIANRTEGKLPLRFFAGAVGQANDRLKSLIGIMSHDESIANGSEGEIPAKRVAFRRNYLVAR
jgi:hypothetical protein